MTIMPVLWKTDEEFMAQFTEEFQALCEVKHGVILLNLTPLQCWVIASQLQLAFRHPQNDGETRGIAEQVVKTLFDYVATTPALAEMARRGWDPAHDVEIEGENDA